MSAGECAAPRRRTTAKTWSRCRRACSRRPSRVRRAGSAASAATSSVAIGTLTRSLRSMAAWNAGVSAIFRRTYKPSTTSTELTMNGTRQPQLRNCSSVSDTARREEQPVRREEADRRPELREHAEPAALAGRRVFGREQRRAAPFAAEADALAEAQDAQQDRREAADRVVARHEADQRGRQAHHEQRCDERRLTADPVAEVAEQERADRPRDECDAERDEGRQGLSRRPSYAGRTPVR